MKSTIGSRRVINTDVVRRMRRNELEEELDTRKVSHCSEESDDDLRKKLMNHEAGQMCPYWEPYE